MAQQKILLSAVRLRFAGLPKHDEERGASKFMFLGLAGKLDAMSRSGAVVHHSHTDRHAQSERSCRT